jgi:hypothetical protein
MWFTGYSDVKRLRRFFSIIFGDGELLSLYRTNFLMMHNFGYDVQALESMIPFEREIYTLMLIDQLAKEQEQKNKG